MKSVKQLSLYLATACGIVSIAALAMFAAPPIVAVAQTAGDSASDLTEGGPLTPEQALDRLSSVPVFAIVSAENAPVLANIERNGQTVQLISFWLDQVAAETALNNIQQANPNVGSQARLVSLSMTEALRVAREQQEESGIQFRVWPNAEIVQTAIQILRETEGEEVENFPGVPLFYGESAQGVLTVEAQGSEIVPFFFSRDDLEATLQRAGENNSAVVSQTQIRVTSLDTVMNSMVSPEAESNVSKIEFVPARSALEYARSLPTNN